MIYWTHMETNASFAWLAAVVPALAAVLSLAAALLLTGLIRLNRGAAINRSWGLLAFSAVCFGLAEADRALDLLGLPSAYVVRDALIALAALCGLVGVILARRLYRKLVD